MKKSFLLIVTLMLIGWAGSLTAQVRSVTLGIRTHCPYGIRGCWAEIRDGLERPSAVAWINQQPDDRTDTCEVRMREDWVPNPDLFAQTFTQMHIGVDVRGVEVVVEGTLEKRNDEVVLRVGGKDVLMRLAPLVAKVQWDTTRKRTQPASRREQRAFEKLCRQSDNSKTVRVTGPLRQTTDDDPKRERLTLEVRKFERLSGT